MQYESLSERNLCPLCLTEHNKEYDSISLLRCGHIYHSACIDDYEIKKWEITNNDNDIHKYIHSICPLCKTKYDTQY